MKRQHDEAFEQYQYRRFMDNEATKEALKPRMLWQSTGKDGNGTYVKSKHGSLK